MSEIITSLKADFQYFEIINFAMAYNKYAIAKFLTISNESDEIAEDLTIEIAPELDFCKAFKTKIKKINAREIVEIEVKLDINQEFIMQLSEAMDTNYVLTITKGENCILNQKFPVKIQTPDFWIMPILQELLSAFVMPNLQNVKAIVSRASKILQEYTGSSIMDGYGSRNINRIRSMAGAIFEALKEQNISYMLPPVEYDDIIGQRVRIPDEVLSNKNGTCIETAILIASCLESVNLNPILIVIRGHAFVGVHLLPETFQNAVSDDITDLTKRLATGTQTIEVFESTMIDDASTVDFDTACLTGAQNLVSLSDFLFFVDIKRCRIQGIKPLPILQKVDGNIKIIENVELVSDEHSKPQEISIYDIPSIKQDNKPVTKQVIWERKLLDLSLRNSLLNMRFNKKNLMIISSGINKIEDIISSGDEFKILPHPPITKADDINIENGTVTVIPGSDLEKFIVSEIEEHRLYSILSPSDNEDSLKTIYRDSKSSMEENGANTLYLALGLLRWYETEQSEQPRYSPILLLPIEIIRRSISSGYIIRGRDEDVIPNITLQEMLRQNFEINLGIPDPLPTDESGVDVPKILAIVRHSIMSQSRWDVEEKAVIGNFSFNKFVMWNDIHSHSDLLANNKIVNSLLEGKLTFEQKNDTLTAEQMDAKYGPAQMLLPVSSDSSQLEAIEEAVSDNSFIMFGPPGTGKSQTITNIIANALYRGKRVLFVAQKAAALEVVRTRLDKLGLSPFCLDVFSNKASKSVVLEQLKNCVDVTRYKEPEEFAADAKRLLQLRIELNNLQESTHKQLPCGISLYDAMSQYVASDESISDEIKIPSEKISSLSKEQKQVWLDIANEASVVCKSCGKPSDNKLNKLKFSNFDSSLKSNLEEVTSSSIKNLNELKTNLENCNQWLKISNHDFPENLQNFETLILEISELKQMNEKAAQFSDRDGNQENYLDAINHGKIAGQKRSIISKKFKESALQKDWTQEFETWKKSENQFFISRWFTRRGIKSALSNYLSGSVELTPESDLQNLIDWQSEKKLSEKYPELNEVFGNMPSETEVDWLNREDFFKEILKIDEMLKSLSANPFEYQNLKQNFSSMFGQGFKMFQDFYSKSFIDTANLIKIKNLHANNLFEISGLDKNAFDEKCENASLLQKRISLVNNIKENLDGLKDWFIYLNLKQKAEENGFDFAMEFFDKTDLEPEKWVATFQKSFYKSIAEYVFASDDNIKLFKGEIFDDKVRQYRELNEKYKELAKAELYAILASRAPNFSTEASKNSEPGILMKNIRSNGRGTSIRKIFDSIPNLLPRLCPCMLMSPMSVAQYLTLTDKPQFDITIFDEASQMTTSDAVGAIARSANVVITGDPKQMPPTSFFSSSSTDEENIEMEDLESILDDALALNFKSKNLLWHYRSKHESLITFSNTEYYDNALLTFPSPDNRISKVNFVKVDGYYDKGKTRRNPAEAKAVVEEIERRLTDPEMRKRSIGVVTFSQVQQQLIDDMLTDLFSKKPELEKIATNCEEPIFVKNLENVQGDERDIILFSVGYGPNEEGKVSMNFGPLNQQGGERRLNVAVSRARYEMKIFSTLTSDMIDLNKTKAEGVAGLKRFLAFAQRGTSAVKNSINLSENLIAEDIKKELKKKNIDCDIQVGNSGFKIDVAVCDPDDNQRYVLAILIDTNDESRIKTARDREICQPSVLNALNWNVMKIWTIDWYNDKAQCIEKILSEIEKSKAPKKQEEEKPKIEIKMEVANSDESNSVSGLYANPNAVRKEDYLQANFDDCGVGAIQFNNVNNFGKIKSQILQIIDSESPILLSYLSKRICSNWGISRITAAVSNTIDKVISELDVKKTSENDDIVLWSNEIDSEKYLSFRVDDARESTEIPLVEYANAVKYVLQTELSLPLDDLKRNTAKQLGFSKLGARVSDLIDMAMSQLVTKQGIVEKDGKFVINN